MTIDVVLFSDDADGGPRLGTFIGADTNLPPVPKGSRKVRVHRTTGASGRTWVSHDPAGWAPAR